MSASRAFAVAFLVSLLPAFGQVPATSSHRVVLNVVVNDKDGKPVGGLGESDFAVTDNDRPEQIVSFRAIGRAQASSRDIRIILLVDEVNVGFRSVSYERDQIKRFLQQDGGRLAMPVSIGFFTDAGLDIQKGSSQDGNALVSYLDQHQTALRESKRSQGFYGAQDRVDWSLRALAQLADTEAKQPGRKLVIWISPGWALLSGPNVQLTNRAQQSIYDLIVTTSRELWPANMTLYSVDPLGTADSGTFRTFYYEQFLKPVITAKQAQIGDLGLQVLADHSGGRVLNSSNNVTGEIERCVRDADDYYVLSYDGPPSDGPNEYHSIQVKINRSGVKAQTQKGYYGAP